ncbi:ribonuclease VapC [Nocardioides baekrokdamisoli]|uniref:Ribonuclease VapC n=1 Tax=Nocardioides baekrokdamisoli TaxID=1804624 RepID=A0A3G9J3B4_9ACTN|nr:type II toxin-antitoxin system VapC family toxin [Nocardioides baekrokdamisoli]BBH18118.1 ribonuclease VapC [Nocardioides baekrokdamisoli]
MIVDASALVCIIKGEPERAAILEVLLSAERADTGAPTLVETRLALRSLGLLGQASLNRLLDALQIGVVPFGAEHAERADEAHQLYGRGSGHPAGLNYGDCMAYAVASVEGRRLLFKGNDFIHIDIESAL